MPVRPEAAPAPRAQDHGGVRVRVIEEEAGLAAVEEGWSALLAGGRSPSPFQTIAWLRAWWRAYGTGSRLRVLIAEGGGAMRAALPLRLTRRGPFRVLSFLGAPRSDFVDALARRDGEEALGALLDSLASARGWDVLHLEDLEEGSLLAGAIRARAPSLGWGLAERDGSVLPILPLDKPWEAYLASRSRKFRQKLRRFEERLSAIGPLSVERHGEDLDAAGAIDVLGAVEARSWKPGAAASRFQSPPDRLFAREALAGLAAAGAADLWIMRLGGAPIAYVLCLRGGSRVLDYSTAFDPGHAVNSPGMLLLARAIESAIAEGATHFDFLRGDEAYKLRWTAASRRNTDLVAWRAGPAGAAAAWATVRWRWAAQRSAWARRLARAARKRAAPGAAEEAD